MGYFFMNFGAALFCLWIAFRKTEKPISPAVFKLAIASAMVNTAIAFYYLSK